MNSYNNLDPSLFHRHDAHTMPQHDLSQEYRRQVHQELTQNYSTFHQPPGAESLPRRNKEIGEQASRMLNAQTDESNKSFYHRVRHARLRYRHRTLTPYKFPCLVS